MFRVLDYGWDPGLCLSYRVVFQDTGMSVFRVQS